MKLYKQAVSNAIKRAERRWEYCELRYTINILQFYFVCGGGHPYFFGSAVKFFCVVFCSFYIHMFVRTDQRVCLAEYDAICESTNGFRF
jgi:hypothetical protein